jgi:hypothetical protein
MNREDPFLAAAQGMANGAIMGRRQGREQGYNQGWDEAIAKMQPEFEVLKADRNDLAWGYNALLAVAAAALDVLEKGPKGQRHAVVIDYLNKVEAWRKSGHLRGIPHSDPCLHRKTPETAAQMQRWVREAIAEANRLKELDNNHAPSP